MTVTVENATWRGKPCYLVHANSHGTVDQVPIGTSVTGTVQVQAWTVLWEFLGGDDCITESLDPLACTRPSSDEFCYRI